MKVAIIALLICSSSILYAMNDEGHVEINGEYMHMVMHLTKAQFDAQHEIENPFIYTDAVGYDAENHKFIVLGNAINLPEDSLDEIEANNFVYVPFYTAKEVYGEYRSVGALILGTNDPEAANDLKTLAMLNSL